MDPLFENLIHDCCRYYRCGNEEDNIDSSNFPDDLKELITEIKEKALPIPTSTEILNYIDSQSRISGWSGKVQYGTMALLHYSMELIKS